LDELPFRAAFGVWGSWVCLLINILSLVAQFYVALYPVGGPNLDANTFFQLYLAGPLLIFLYLVWKIYSWFVRPEDRPLFIRTKDIDIYTGMREEQRSRISGTGVSDDQRRASILEMQDEKRKKGPKDYLMAGIRNII
jgi:amino acid transporter